jgi:23S rRNA pseudouridine1911/1915/1917 synthase
MASQRWVVGPEDAGRPLAEVVARMGAAAAGAIAEGRVFVRGARATGDEQLAPGDAIEIWAARTTAEPVRGARPWLVRDREVLFADKPASLPTEPDHRGGDSLVARLALALGVERVHAASRLDVGVSGVVACASGPRGARRLAQAQECGELRRVYLAIAGGSLEGAGTWDGALDGKPAVTRWRTLASARGATALELELVTGRTHQIRRHAAAAGAPLIGDRAHGGLRRVTRADGAVIEVARPMLHAAATALDDGVGQPLMAIAEVPEELRSTWTALDGDPAAWEEWRPPWEEVEPRAAAPSSAASPRPRSASPRRRPRS